MRVSRVIDGNKGALPAAVCVLLLFPAILSADRRLDTGELPESLINTEDCIITGSFGWGWDGQQTCRVTGFQFDGEARSLTATTHDSTGSALVWNHSDLANKTVRCDRYERAFFNAESRYNRDRYDITFLIEDAVPDSAPAENLSEVTAHLYTRGWEISQFGTLDTGSIVNFNRRGVSTDAGYIFIEDSSLNSNNQNIVREFSPVSYTHLTLPTILLV